MIEPLLITSLLITYYCTTGPLWVMPPFQLRRIERYIFSEETYTGVLLVSVVKILSEGFEICTCWFSVITHFFLSQSSGTAQNVPAITWPNAGLFDSRPKRVRQLPKANWPKKTTTVDWGVMLVVQMGWLSVCCSSVIIVYQKCRRAM